eukprot:CAMPEP_0179095866 /NCGR_PEP_ID=MMETSP0796-20121207/44037_1 /TAXON_ID=73915 /ORGANISM="Pyrodinium bahamense, Strain pbaha01" /LENGTH=266 /DNA_ID=CAMNT_0020793563 /DNA_START=161 /DNA_END=961 /DNA_ORIENTATION=+
MTEIWWGRLVAPSSKEHENDKYWMARNVLGIIHAVFVSVIAMPALLSLSGAPDDVRFAYSTHLETCAMDPGWYEDEGYGRDIERVALAGLAFTAFTTADVALSIFHGLATWDYMWHHAAFIACGLIMRGNCMLPWKGSVQLAMEASTPFLNFMLFFVNRGKTCWPMVVIAGVIFAVSFVILRLVQNAYATVVLWLRHDIAMPPMVPWWMVWPLLLAVTAGAAVQFYWFPLIVKKILKLRTEGGIDKSQHGLSNGNGVHEMQGLILG